MPEPSLKTQGWALFDEIVNRSPDRDTNPWIRVGSQIEYHPDYRTLAQLLGVPLILDATSQSGVPALALDVWTAYELRRAGFERDRVWPRASSPRVLPQDVALLVESLPKSLRAEVQARLDRGLSGGTASASANLLGKNYVKQVDVVMSSWATGPELMISTKRMDSSFGKNAANRVEESYGDAKNLSLRHPQAALGFLYSLRSTAFDDEPDVADWLVDLLAKLGREEDAYDAVCLIVPEWGAPLPLGDDGGESEDAAPVAVDPVADIAATAVEPTADTTSAVAELSYEPDPEDLLDHLPEVTLRHDRIPAELSPARFFTVMVDTVLNNSPINFHRDARKRRTLS